jgi:hypothetical protein
MGFLLAQVPLNSPFLRKIRRTEINAKKTPTRAVANNTVAIGYSGSKTDFKVTKNVP